MLLGQVLVCLVPDSGAGWEGRTLVYTSWQTFLPTPEPSGLLFVHALPISGCLAKLYSSRQTRFPSFEEPPLPLQH